jgi:Ca2+-binding RTX toxin-like protein
MSKKNDKKRIGAFNYKIESLEPRMMMNADVVLDDLEDNLSSISTTVESALSEVDDLQLSGLGLDESLDSASAYFSGVGSNIQSLISTALENYRDALPEGTASVSLAALVSGLNTNLPGQLPSNIENPVFSASDNDTLKLNFRVQNSLSTSELELDEIELGVDNASISLLATGSLSIEIDLDADDDGEWFENATDVELSASVESIGVSVPNVGASSSFMGLTVVETSLQDPTLDSADIAATYQNATTDVGLDLEFSLGANDGFPFEFVNANDVIKVNGPENGEFSVNMPSLQPKQGIGNFSLEHIFDNKVDFSQIPFIHNCDYEEVKISDIVGNLQEYWARASFAINGAVENGALNLEKIGTYFEKLVEEKQSILGSLLEHLSLDDGNGHVVNLVGDGQNVLQNVALSTSYEAPTSLYLNITPTIANMATGTDELVNLGLLKLGDLNVDCSVRIKLDVHINSATGKLCFDSFNLDKFDLSISKDNINETISLGLFSATVTNGIFSLTASYDANNGSVFTAIPKFSVESATLKSGTVTVAKLDAAEDPYEFGYDSLTENWIVPDEIKAFASLSGETLSHQVVAYLQSMQTALRKQLEDNVKLDFLGSSIEKVADVVDKIDMVVNGFEDPSNSANNVVGLFVVDKGKYKANFSSIETFVDVFNNAWKKAFEINDDVCSLSYVGFVGDETIVINDVGNATESTRNNFKLDHYTFEFNLKFNKEVDFDLNLARSLGDGFANVATYGNVSAGCSAGISFSLDVKFDYQTINDGNGEDPATTLGVIFGEDNIALNETYYESTPFDRLSFNETRTDVKLDGSTANFAFTFKVDDQIVMVQSGAIDTSIFKCVEKVQDKENEFVSSTATSLPKIEYNENIKKLIITSDNKFDIESSGNADAFSELKLVNTVQQTCFAITSDSNTSIVVSLKGVGNADNVDITLDPVLIQDFMNDLNDKGLSDSSDWKKCLDNYLSLQKSDENQFGLNEVLSTGSLEDGRSIKNTYGLYVVDINEGTDEILFGCDPSLIKGYKTKREGNGIKIDSDYYTLESNSGFKYMRISGVLNASGAIGSQKGVLIEKYSESLGYASEYIDLSSGTTDVDALQENLDGFAAGAFVAKEIENNGVGIGLVDSRYVSYWQDFSKLASDADVSEIYRVTVSDNFLAVVVGNDSVHVDTKNCSDLNDLSRAIKDSLDANTIQGVKSVVAQNNRIVFTVDENTSLSWFGYLHQLSSLGSDDFKIKGSSAPIDFESLNFDENTTVQSFVTTINTQLNGTGVYLCYSETDPESHATTYWDHFEFRSNSPFSFENVGASKILEKLGFSALNASKCGDSDYRIVGRTLLGVDWSKLFNFTENTQVVLSADLTFSIEKDVKVGDTAPSLDQQNNTRTITLETPVQKNVFAVGGLIKNGDEYFKILELKAYGDDENLIDSVVVSNVAVVVSENIASSATWIANSTLKYVAAIDATFGFVDVNLVAFGSVSANVKFVGQKNADSETLKENDSFLSNWNFSLDCDDDDFGGQFDVRGVVTGLGANTIYLGDNSVSLKLEDNLPKIDCNFNNLENAITNNFANLSNFSVQDVYALLEGLVQRLTAVAQNSDAKIPVINKSVGDLVNVANDIRDIVSKLRKDNIVSLQGLSNRLTKYLEDAGLVAAQNIDADASIFGIDVVDGSVVFDFNISKGFSAVHKFNFGGSGGGISGNADLKVEGDFWFSLSAEMSVGSSFDFILKDAIQFGANINIVGQKLSFNLGIDGDGQTKGFDALLKNLITVGSDKGDSFVVGKAALIGGFGAEGVSLKTWKLDGTNYNLYPSFVIPMSIFGNLPISVCGYELGSIKFGKWNGNEVICENDVNNVVGKALSDVSSWLNTRTVSADSSVNIVAEKTASGTAASSMNIKLILEDKSSVNAGDLVVDFSEVYKRIEDLAEGNLDWFEKIKLAVTGLNNLLDSLESSINSGMMSNIKDVPVVGSAVSGGVDFLSKLKQQILEPFSDFVYESTGMTAEMVARKMNELLGEYLIKSEQGVTAPSITVGEGSISWENDIADSLYYRSGQNYAEWFFRLGGDYSLGADLGLDLGFPGLGLETEGGLNLSLAWTLEFGFGVSENGGFYFIFEEGNELNVVANAIFDNAQILGKMAGLGVGLTFGSDDIVILNFGVDLDKNNEDYNTADKILGEYGGDSQKLVGVTLSNAIGQPPFFNYSASVNLTLDMVVGVLKDVQSSDTPKFPNIEGQFEFKWTDGEIEKLGFNSFKLDMGSFIGGVLGPIVSKIQKVVEPLKPLIDFLTTPFPVLDDLGIEITPLSLAKEFSKGKFDDSMVYAIKDLIALSEKVAAFGKKELKIDIGSMSLIGGLGVDSESVNDFVKGNVSVSDFGKLLDDANNGYLSSLDSVRGEASSALSGNGLQVGDGSWKFIWDEPTNIFKLLLGQDIDLVHYDMPKLSFDFDWDTFIRIWAPLGVRLGVSFNASIDLAFGYDTLGIRQWVGSDYKDYSRLLNGFYVDDLDGKGNDKNELSFYGGLKASAELNAGVSAGVGGGVGINVGFNLFDPNKDGKLRLNEIERVFKEEGLFGMFDVNGAITAKLYAYLDLLFYTKKWNITDDITLFEFNYEHTVKPVMISKSGDDVVANIGSNASSRVATNDLNKTLDDGDEILELDVNGSEVFDKYGHSEKVDGRLIINAEKGNDKIYIKLAEGNVVKDANFDIEINGGDGDDYIDLSGLQMASNCTVFIWGGAGNDTIIGADGLNIIFGDIGTVRKEDDKYIIEANVDPGVAGNDIILGGSKKDIIFGGAGDDQIDGGAGADFIFGDGGRIVFDDSKPEGEKWAIDRTDISLDGGKDTLIGGDDDDVIYGGGGDDHVDGGAGNDEIYGERGQDRILGGSGNDTIHGGEGMDIVFGDRINSTPMDLAAPFAVDTTNKTAAFSQEFIDAQFKKNDVKDTEINENEFKIKVDKSADYYKNYTEEIKNKINNEGILNSSSDTLTENNFGSDFIYGDDGNDLLFGDDGGDTAVGGADKIYGGIGNDIIDGDGGADTISGGIDNDLIYGGAGDDIIDGGAGNDMLYGDNGVIDYDSTGITLSGETGNQLGNDKIVFGDNLGLHGELYANAKVKPNANGGNDKIITGPGMDFVDGQGGSDVVTVNLMGESSVGYANVTDSGIDGSDTLVVEGTESDDNLLVRRNKKTQGEPGDLGFVAMLPTEPDPNNLSLNTNIERVNFTSAIETLNLNANGGNDTVAVDGTASTTNINGGAGNDTVLVGQLYNSERDNQTPASIQPVDVFRTQQTNEEKYLSDGVSKNTTLNVDGDIGDDTFAALNNAGSLNMSGGKGDDKFSVYGFQDKNDKTIVRGAMSIDGGLGNDSMFVRGTNGDDTVIVSKDGMLSDIVSVKASGVESTTFDAAAGDDLFNVIGNNKGEITNLNGGKGNDTFSMGGLDADHTLRSSNTDGQSCDIKYELLDSENKVLESKTESYTLYDTSSEPVVFVSSEEHSIVIPEITLSEVNNGVGVAFFYVHYSGDLLNGQSVGTVKVNLSAPMLSAKALKSGAREIMLAEVSGSDTDFSSNWNLCSTLPVELNSSKKFAKIAVCLFADALEESESLKSITISSECDNVALTKSVSSLPIKISADGAVSRLADGLLAEAEEFVVSGDSVQLGNVANGLDPLSNISAYIVGACGFLTQQTKSAFDAASDKTNLYCVENGVLYLDSALTKKNLVVLYRASSLRIDGSKAHLVYDDVDASKIKVEYKAEGSTTASEILARGAAEVEGVTYVAGVEYELQGDTIVFYNSINGRMMTLHGELTISPRNNGETDVFLPPESDMPTSIPSIVDTAPSIHIDEHPTILAETGTLTSVSYGVSLAGDFNGRSSVKVRISVLDAVSSVNQDGTYNLTKEMQFVDANGNVDPTTNGEYIELTFTPENANQAQTVRLRAKTDTVSEEYGFVTVHKTEKNLVDDIDGAVYAFGMGQSVELDTDNPSMLSYAHKVNEGSSYVEASTLNEKNDYASDKLFGFTSVTGKTLVITIESANSILTGLGINLSDSHSFEGKTIRLVASSSNGIVVGEGNDKKTYRESDWFKIVSCVANGSQYTLTLNESVSVFDANNSNVLFSGSKDYLFIDEDASVDRLFVNNQGDEENETSSLNAFAVKNGNVSSEERAEFGNSAASIEQNIQDAERTVMDFDEHAVRFEHDDIGKRGIAAAQMEYAEYNLGSGSDTVNVNKTIYREDGFQTFTVVNTGSGVSGGNATDDTVNINSYAEESATEIASGTSAVLSGTADNGGATYAYTLTGSVEAFNEAKSALDVSEKIYVDATLSDGTTQRREVTEFDSVYFAVKRAFTLASGVSVDSVSFKHGYSGDGQLVVNAQGGDDIINATSNAVTRNDMVVFGGLGDDTINMNRGGIAFGDRGQVLYGEDPENPVTVLGSTNSGLDYTTGISKNHGDDTATNGPVHRLQTDGVRRGAYEIHSMNDSEGGSDTINVGGTDSVVIGGADGDTITVSGNNNIALGDNGSVKYYNAANVGAVYGDSLNLGLHTVETTSDSVGDVDTVTISGNKNVAMGGEAGDTIGIGGSDNVVIGDGGRYTVLSDRLVAESKSDTEGGSDTITTGDGKNAIIGGTDADTITTGAGNDIIVGDGGKVIMDTGRNALMVTNKDRNITGAGLEDGSAGGDTIDAGNGRNVVFGGLDSDHIKTGEGEDVVFGDNGFATFQGNAAESGVETRTEATLSFNFQGASQTGLSSEAVAGALNATHGDDYRSANWNNVGGNLAGTYGNDDREVVRFDDGTRASAVSVSYGGIESHRNTDTDNRINLQAYGHNFANASTDADAALMNAGLMTTAPNAQCDNRLEVVVDGLAQYFTEYRVVVYLDIPDSHSAYEHSIRKVSLYVGDSSAALQSFYVDDAEGENFDGGYERATATTASAATYANYAVFTVSAASFADNFRVVIEDAFPDQHPNGKNLPGIAAIQVRGDLHAQDVAVSTQLNLGGDDIVSTGGGDDIVVGGAGSDYMATFGELAGGIRDNDLVFGDSASLRFEDRLGTGDTMVSSARSLDPDADDLVQGVSFDDRIVTGDGNDTVVGGLGGDKILAGSQSELTQLGIAQAFFGEEATVESLDATNGPAAIRDLETLKDATVDGRKVLSVNFTTRGADDSTMASGHAGVVHDTGWNNLYLYNGHLYTHEGNENSTTPVLRYSDGGTVTDSSVGISLTSYDSGTTDQGQNGSLVFRTSTELDGDTANSRLFAGYTAAQQQQDIHVSLTNLSSFRGAGGTCDVYVYLGADDSDTDAHSHIYEIQGSEDGSRYLNDWKGHAFDGDYREATCRSRSDALANLAVGATPMVELIGNYVVFHNVAGDSFDLYIRNLHTEGGQWPMNLPVIAAIQVVAGSGRADAAVGGDHDRDLVFGDSAALTFDMDVPYAAGEDLADFANINRVNGASSVALDDGLYALGADDAIYTGMDRDVVVAGEGDDLVTLGSGDDVALGDNASLVLEHNNPVGVFRPDVETVLESNNYQADNAAYLGSPTVDAEDIQDKFEDGDVPGVTLEASANGGTDTFTDATDKDWTVQQEVTPGTISRPIDIPAAGVPVEFREGETVLLTITPSSPWYQHRLQIGTEGGGTIPPLTLEWVVDGVTVTESVSNPYWNEKELPANPNAGTYYEIRVTALAAGNAKFTFI